MWPDRVSNPGSQTYESGALPTALRGPPKDVMRQSTCMVVSPIMVNNFAVPYTVEIQWLEHLWDHENMFETRVIRANEC